MKRVKNQLRSWQRREWLYQAVWGIARWAVLVIGVLTLACFLDWWIDKYIDLPFAVRVLVTGLELAVAAGSAYLLVVRLRTPGLIALAGRAEKAFPVLGHRLVTALQLNRPGAKIEGMSRELIRQVTEEAEAISARHHFAALADPRRLKWAAGLLLPVLTAAAAFTALRPELVGALLARQALFSVEIPRSVRVVNRTPELWPSGDEVELLFEVTGPVAEDAVGKALVVPEDQPAETFPVTFKQRIDENRALFAARVPPSTTLFAFRAWVADGRTRQTGFVRFEPRPVVRDLTAWVLLPVYVDPEGKNRYERLQPQGEVVALPDWSVRVEIATTKPVVAAVLVAFARDEKGLEQPVRRVPMQLAPDGQAAGVVFDLPPRASSYRVEVTDANGFANSNPPRRGINLAVDEPPRVNLLAEVLKDPREEGPLDDFDVTGMPLGIGGQVQIGYDVRSPLGLARAQVVYRVNDGPWTALPLRRTEADESKLGKFLPELGVFRESGPFGQVEFYPLPSPDPTTEPPGIEAGGRINFQTAALTKPSADGRTAKLEVGDRVELAVEVFDRNPAPGRPPGRSVSRIKTVVSQAQLQAWLDQHDQSRDRLRKLEESQRGVFSPKSQ
jgi:hypothetical protein